MPAGSRKGFKFIPSSAKPVVTETLSYDEVEKEGTTTPGASRKRGATRALEAKAAKARKIAATVVVATNAEAKKITKDSSSSSSSRSKSNSAEVVVASSIKSHYPSIDMPINKIKNILKSKNINNKSHAEILDRLVIEVCTAEREGLNEFFKDKEGKETLHDVLNSVLDDIPTQITSNCDEDVEFLPEFISGEKSEVAILTDVLNGLKEYSSKLTEYENDMNKLSSDYDMWLTSGPSNDIINEYNSDENTKIKHDEMIKNIKSNFDLNTLTDNYQQKLHEINESCKSILVDISNANDTEINAAKVQEKLYRNYNRTRLEVGPAGVTLPTASTKDLMRGFGRME